MLVSNFGFSASNLVFLSTPFQEKPNLKSTGLDNPFLATNLHAEAAVHTSESIDRDAAILSPYQGGALESFEAVPAPDTGAHRWHIDR